MKKYHIENLGCDDENKFNIELSDEEFKTVIKLFDANNKLASYQCCPRLYIYEYKDGGNYYDEDPLNKTYRELKEEENK